MAERPTKRMRVVAAALLLTAAGPAVAQTAGRPTDWPTYGHDAGGMRYSPLAQINPGNVGTLRPAWVYHMRPAGAAAPAPAAPGRAEAAQAQAEGAPAPAPAGRAFVGTEVTPLVVGGLMYITTPYRKVVALDPATGREVWSYALPGTGQPSIRGVEYWPGDRRSPPRILFGARDGQLIALDARSGVPVAGFGDGGVVNLRTPEVMNGFPNAAYGMTSPPLVWRDLVFTGAAVQESAGPGAAGDVRAWDVRTGKLVWTFHSVPRPDEPGAETWGGDSARNRSGTNVWGFMTADAARGVLYLPFGAPAWDRYGGDRPGDNLFSTTLVAVDARTGKRLWHFQVVRHDIWDFDLQAPPTLFEVRRGGRTIPAVGMVSKNGLMFMLDRVTGRPIYEIEERPVPASDVPGERVSPTQPFPVKPEPLSRITLTEADLPSAAATTPEHARFCADLVRTHNIRLGGPYLPTGLNRVTVNMPGTQGGANWGGGAVDPRLGYFFVNVLDMGQLQTLSPALGGALPYGPRGPVSGRFWDPKTRLMCTEPPWGQMVAVNVNTGEIAWRSTLGVSDNLPADRQRTGRPSMGGPIATAGGLVFIAATDDSRFRAFDSRTGKEVWTARLEASAHATPITYQGGDGRQYVAVVSTGGSFLASPVTSDAVTAFALPR